MKNVSAILQVRNWQPDTLVNTLIAVNATWFVLLLLAAPGGIGWELDLFSFLSPAPGSLFFFGASGALPVLHQDRWWTLLTANYLHVSAAHLAFNMLVLRSIGRLAAGAFGPQRMFALYTLGGMASMLGSCLAGTPLTAGASGALCSLLGGIAYLEWRVRRQPIRKLAQTLGAWIFVLFATGFVLPAIDHWAHVSGLVAGAVLGYALARPWTLRNEPVMKRLATGCLLLTIGGLLWPLAGILLA